jgi:hypothetical protein
MINSRTIICILIGAAALGPLITTARCDVTDIFFSAYDQNAQNTPFYNTFGVTSDLTITQLDKCGVQLLDSGYQDPYVQAEIQGQSSGAFVDSSALRSVGWHTYEFSLNSTSDIASVFMDGNLIDSGSFSFSSNSPLYLYMTYHNYYSGTNVSLIEDVSVTFDNQTVFQDSFNSTTLNSNWIIDRLDSGTYITPGGGQLQMGNTGGGNVASILALPVPVPEPSTWAALSTGLLALLVFRRRL